LEKSTQAGNSAFRQVKRIPTLGSDDQIKISIKYWYENMNNKSVQCLCFRLKTERPFFLSGVDFKMKKVSKIMLCTLGPILVCVGLLTISSCIPRSFIQKNSKKSAEYFAEREAFPILIGNYVNSMQDNYSDTVLCDIIYCIDTGHPFESAIRARFSQGENENASDGYLNAVRVNDEPDLNQEYGRYWHGTMVVLRPLLIFMPIWAIRILFGGTALIIQIALIIMLKKRGHPAFAVCYLLAFILMEPWMFFTSLEYGTAFLTASVAEILVMLKRSRWDETRLMSFFTSVGVVTCFVDFLTTETLTFTLPMLMIFVEGLGGRLITDKRTTGKKSSAGSSFGKGMTNEGIVSILKNGSCWFFGYAMMFVTKIVLLFIVAGNDTTREALAEGLFRLGGEVHSANVDIATVVDVGGRLSGAIWHNLACLYPTEAGQMNAVSAWIPTIFILILGFTAVYLLQDGIDHSFFVPTGLMALIPYLRFLVLSNHSFIHFFITYRAQMVTVAVFLFFVYENALKHFKEPIKLYFLRRRKMK